MQGRKMELFWAESGGFQEFHCGKFHKVQYSRISRLTKRRQGWKKVNSVFVGRPDRGRSVCQLLPSASRPGRPHVQPQRNGWTN